MVNYNVGTKMVVLV